jgi:C4-dicarboxylate-specific signal transduction histidine kinase
MDQSFLCLLKFFKGHFQLINSGIDRTKFIVESLSHFANQDVKQTEYRDATEITQNIVTFSRSSVARDTQLDVQLLASGKVYVQKQSFQLILLSIFDNALDAVQAVNGEKYIKLKLFAEDPKLVLSIFNTGKRIPEEKMHKIFDLFYTTKDGKQNTGASLGVVLKLVKEQQGDIKVLNHKNGVEFLVKLPIIRNPYP